MESPSGCQRRRLNAVSVAEEKIEVIDSREHDGSWLLKHATKCLSLTLIASLQDDRHGA